MAAEQSLLEERGNEVRVLMFDNANIKGGIKGIKSLIQSVYNRDAYKRVLAEIEDFQPDVMHVHNTFYVASHAVYHAAKHKKVPVIQTLHNYRLVCPSAFLFHKGDIYIQSVNKVFPLDAVLKRVWDNSFVKTFMIALTTALNKRKGTYQKLIDKYVVFTEFSKDIFLHSSLNLREEQLAIKPNFIPDPGVNSAEREDFYLFVGRLSPEKGISVLLEAAKKEGFPLYILGDGPLRHEVEAAEAESPNIKYLGHTSREEVLEYFKKTKALIFPSLWYEGMPMVIVECMASGAPIIVSDLGNPGVMVTHEANGLKFEAGNADELIKQVRKLEQNPHLVDAYSNASRNTYMDHYSPSANYQRLMEIYHSAINQNVNVHTMTTP